MSDPDMPEPAPVGLDLSAPDSRKLAELTALSCALAEILRGSSADRASRAAIAAHGAMDASLGANPTPAPPACFKGCGHCCRVYVSATGPEVFALAAGVRAMPAIERADIVARLVAAVAAVGERDWSRDIFFTHPCPLLDDTGACRVHPLRPDACRGVSSYDDRACRASIAALGRREDLPIPWVEEHRTLRGAHALALAAALRAAGLADAYYSLNPALLRALEDADAEAKWLSGEDVFAGVAVDGSQDEGSRRLMNTVLAALQLPSQEQTAVPAVPPAGQP